MRHIGMNLKQSRSRIRETERGELMKYFCSRLNATRGRDGLPHITMPRMGKILEQIPTKDLYYLKRVCDDAGNFSKKFWWLLNPKNHEEYEKGLAEHVPSHKIQSGRSGSGNRNTST